jgi:predicted dehydrogenase
MMESKNLNVLQIGLGGFGKNHLRAWHEMGKGSHLYIAELNSKLHEDCRMFNVPSERLGTDARAFLDKVDIVDIVTPSTSHFELCRMALEAGKDVFVEKPMTMTSAEATALAELSSRTSRLIQVGYYYRFHPLSVYLKQQIEQKTLGVLRYLSGNFMGFKRARTDVGVTHTDGIHFIDLFNWLIGEPPANVYAVVRDHFKRGLEDFSLVQLQYPGGQIAKVESGYIQPGRWHDKVVPNAMTSKEIYVCGERATIEVDFETENLVRHDIHHEFKQNTWHPVGQGSALPPLGTATPIRMIADELQAFLNCVRDRSRPSADVIGSGVVLAKLMEALYESARRNAPVDLRWTPAERESLRSGTQLASV